MRKDSRHFTNSITSLRGLPHARAALTHSLGMSRHQPRHGKSSDLFSHFWLRGLSERPPLLCEHMCQRRQQGGKRCEWVNGPDFSGGCVAKNKLICYSWK